MNSPLNSASTEPLIVMMLATGSVKSCGVEVTNVPITPALVNDEIGIGTIDPLIYTI